MPDCGTQVILCDVPIRFDNYVGCSHACEYCFAKQFKDISTIKKGETPSQLLSFIKGERAGRNKWCDWNIPLHWGGLSDPFQPCERKHKTTLECLKILKETQYPFIVSTKGRIVAEEPYLTLLSQCNAVVQISLVAPSYNKIEEGCPPYEERLEIVKKVAPRVKRLIIRIQPYMTEVYDEVYNALEEYAKAGVYGVILEGMKFKKKKPGLEKVGGDFVYDYDTIRDHALKLKKRAHELGLKFYCGENRLRVYGDSLTCCGCDGMEGFKVNKFNLNHILHGDKDIKPTKAQLKVGNASCFEAYHQVAGMSRVIKNSSFYGAMLSEYKNKKNTIEKTFGIDKRRKGNKKK